MKERKHYIDIAKGLLILMVVWSHFELILRLCFQQSDIVVDYFNGVKNIWNVFYMPAFFFITGFCSNFQKPFKPFLTQSFKTILLPALIITSILSLHTYMNLDVSWLWIAKTMIKSLLLQGCSGEWFISSLFLAKIACWAILRIRRKSIMALISCFSFAIGITLYNSFAIIPEIWYFKHALMAILFMMSGILLKDKVEKYYKLWWLYIPLIACALLAVRFDIISHSLPYFTNRINIIYIYIPLYILLSYIGINFILGLSKQIKVSPLLEYLGRNSLVIFLLHFTFYQIFISYVLPYLGRSIYLSACIVALVYLLNVITCCGFAYLLNLKPLRWILGK